MSHVAVVVVLLWVFFSLITVTVFKPYVDIVILRMTCLPKTLFRELVIIIIRSAVSLSG